MSTDKEVKLCKDCKYSRKRFLLPWNLATCVHPENYSLVDGGVVSSSHFCENERHFNHLCGPSAKRFEPKFVQILVKETVNA